MRLPLVYSYWETEYISLIIHMFITFLIIFLLWFISINLKSDKTLFENASQYECGFESFGSNFEFNSQYFIIAILYLIFDIELVLLLPWVLYINALTYQSILIMAGFILLFVIGLVYEWKKRVLHWS
jgi:NADH:ubiquinone oxidoreductase subunit 3 (subunit A)